MNRKGSFVDADVTCWWCHTPAKDSPYRSPIKDIPGGRYIVCGPTCPDRPEEVQVYTDWKSK